MPPSWRRWPGTASTASIPRSSHRTGRRQLGTLGSGNHFIEITADERQRVWAFLHSGSRGVGNKIVPRHIAVARELCDRWWIPLPDADLAYLPEHTDEFFTHQIVNVKGT